MTCVPTTPTYINGASGGKLLGLMAMACIVQISSLLLTALVVAVYSNRGLVLQDSTKFKIAIFADC